MREKTNAPTPYEGRIPKNHAFYRGLGRHSIDPPTRTRQRNHPALSVGARHLSARHVNALRTEALRTEALQTEALQTRAPQSKHCIKRRHSLYKSAHCSPQSDAA